MSELEATGLRLVIKHINKVQCNMADFIGQLSMRAANHDISKYSQEEIGLVLGKPSFDKYEYMSVEERAALTELKEAVNFHYTQNSHHPEHYPNGIAEMTLLDLVEMFYDWKAASEMSKNGNFLESIEYGKERFAIDDQIVEIFKNTAREFNLD